jgi:hypothetical protein
MSKYAVEVEANKADGFNLPEAKIIDRKVNAEDGTVVFIVESKKDIRWSESDQPEVIAIEPL